MAWDCEGGRAITSVDPSEIKEDLSERSLPQRGLKPILKKHHNSEERDFGLSYRSDLEDFKQELRDTGTTHKARILKLAKVLEDEQQIPIQNICTTILCDLREEIEEGLIHKDRIWKSLPERYKLPNKVSYGRERRKKRKRNGGSWHTSAVKDDAHILDLLINLIEDLSGLDMKQVKSMPPQELAKKCEIYQRWLLLPLLDEYVDMTSQELGYLYHLLRQFIELTEQERAARRKKAELLSR